jgi:hypothetical protein
MITEQSSPLLVVLLVLNGACFLMIGVLMMCMVSLKRSSVALPFYRPEGNCKKKYLKKHSNSEDLFHRLQHFENRWANCIRKSWNIYSIHSYEQEFKSNGNLWELENIEN